MSGFAESIDDHRLTLLPTQISLTTDVKYRLISNPHAGSDWIRPYIDESLDPWRIKWLSPDLDGKSSVGPLYD